jgi:Ca2+-binding EF-hand superfamily protein
VAFKICFRSVCICSKYAEDALEEEAAKIFSAADNDNNEVLSHTELKHYIQAHDEIKKRLVKIGSGEECGWSGLFKDADADGDGEITLAVFAGDHALAH